MPLFSPKKLFVDLLEPEEHVSIDSINYEKLAIFLEIWNYESSPNDTINSDELS